MVRYLCMLSVWGALGLAAALVCIPWTLLTRDVRLMYSVGLAVMRIGLLAGGVRVVVRGRELVPKGVPCLYLANHQSNLDPPLLASVQPANAAMMVKKSLMRIPVLGLAMRLGHCVPVDRSGGVESAKQGLRDAAAVLATGLSLTVFPEGTRSEDGQLLPFKKGPFFVAMQTGAPVIPVTIAGTGAMLGKGRQRLTPGTAHVTFHPALDPTSFATRDELMQAVRGAISSALPASQSAATAS